MINTICNVYILTFAPNTETVACVLPIAKIIQVKPIPSRSVWTIMSVNIIIISKSIIRSNSTGKSNSPLVIVIYPYSIFSRVKHWYVMWFSIDSATFNFIISKCWSNLSPCIILLPVIYFYFPATRIWNIFEFEKNNNLSRMLHIKVLAQRANISHDLYIFKPYFWRQFHLFKSGLYLCVFGNYIHTVLGSRIDLQSGILIKNSNQKNIYLVQLCLIALIVCDFYSLPWP